MLPAHYSLSWAISVVERLQRKHPRGVQVVCELYHISLKDMAIFLAVKDNIWRDLRQQVQWVSTADSVGHHYYTNEEWLTVFRKYIKGNNRERLLSRLDKQLDLFKMKERETRGGEPRAEGDGLPDILASL